MCRNPTFGTLKLILEQRLDQIRCSSQAVNWHRNQNTLLMVSTTIGSSLQSLDAKCKEIHRYRHRQCTHAQCKANQRRYRSALDHSLGAGSSIVRVMPSIQSPCSAFLKNSELGLSHASFIWNILLSSPSTMETGVDSKLLHQSFVLLGRSHGMNSLEDAIDRKADSLVSGMALGACFILHVVHRAAG